MFKMILACDEMGGIGNLNGLPWHCPQDLEHFKDLTRGSTVLMGYNTFKSLPTFPAGLPNRRNLVICRDPNDVEHCDDSQVRFITWDEVWELWDEGVDLWVIGGAATYDKLTNFCEVLWITFIDGIYETDASVCIPMLIGNKKPMERRQLADNAVAVRYVELGAV